MWIELIEVKKSRNGAMGNFYPAGRGRYKHHKISLSLHHNPTLAEYAATLLHELLHLWVFALRLKGFRVRGTTEHRFINKVEDTVLSQLKYLSPLKRRRKHAKKYKSPQR